MIDKHLENLAFQVANLRTLRSLSFVEFSQDWKSVYAAERGLQVAIQNMLDIGAHILADFGDARWDEYKQIPVELARYGVIPKDFVKTFQEMAGMRNILVHQYTEVDVGKMYEVLQQHLDDFDRFAQFIKAYLEREAE